MRTTEKTRCNACGKRAGQVELLKCPACFEPVCENCACRMGGRDFCSKACARYFFFEDEEEG